MGSRAGLAMLAFATWAEPALASSSITVLDGAGPGTLDASWPVVIQSAGDPGAQTLSEATVETFVPAGAGPLVETRGLLTIDPLTDGILSVPYGPGTTVTFRAGKGDSQLGTFTMAPGDRIRTIGADLQVRADQVTAGELWTVSAFDNVASGDVRIEAPALDTSPASSIVVEGIRTVGGADLDGIGGGNPSGNVRLFAEQVSVGEILTFGALPGGPLGVGFVGAAGDVDITATGLGGSEASPFGTITLRGQIAANALGSGGSIGTDPGAIRLNGLTVVDSADGGFLQVASLVDGGLLPMNGDVEFTRTVNGASAWQDGLRVVANWGTTRFRDSVGGLTPLGQFTTVALDVVIEGDVTAGMVQLLGPGGPIGDAHVMGSVGTRPPGAAGGPVTANLGGDLRIDGRIDTRGSGAGFTGGEVDLTAATLRLFDDVLTSGGTGAAGGAASFAGETIVAPAEFLVQTRGGTGAAGGDVLFDGTLRGDAGTESLLIRAGTGDVTFTDDVFNLDAVTIADAHDVTATRITSRSFRQTTGTGTTDVDEIQALGPGVSGGVDLVSGAAMLGRVLTTPITPGAALDGGDVSVVVDGNLQLDDVFAGGADAGAGSAAPGGVGGDVFLSGTSISWNGAEINAQGGRADGTGVRNNAGDVRLRGPVTLDAGSHTLRGRDVTLDETLDGLATSSFSVEATNDVAVQGAIGSTGAPERVQIDTSGNLALRDASTIGDQTYTAGGAITVASSYRSTGGGGTVRFRSPIVQQSNSAMDAFGVVLEGGLSQPFDRLLDVDAAFFQLNGGLATSYVIDDLEADITGGSGFEVLADVDLGRGRIASVGDVQIGGNDGTADRQGRLAIDMGSVDATLLVGSPGVASGELRIGSGTVDFVRLVTNTTVGTIKNDGGTARFLGGLTNNGAFISDPADNIFADLMVGKDGYLVGSLGDRFIVQGDLLSSSEASVLWDTGLAELVFEENDSHTLAITSADLGDVFAGYRDNFAWGALRLASGQGLVLEDGGGGEGGALYVRELDLADGLTQLSLIESSGLSIYYDPNEAANAYLGGKSFSLAGGGKLAAVPEPSTVFLVASGLVLVSRRLAIGRRLDPSARAKAPSKSPTSAESPRRASRA